MISTPLLLTATIALVVALAFWLDYAVPVLSKLGASLVVIFLGASLSNLGLVPAEAVVYDVIEGPLTSLAIAWLLLAVNLGDLKRAGPRMVGAFALAVAGTAVGAFVGALVFQGDFAGETWRLAGTFMGTYSGGGLNFTAVGRGVELPNQLFVGALAADNATTAIWLAATLTLPLWLRRYYPTPVPGELQGVGSDQETVEIEPPAPEPESQEATGDSVSLGHPFFHRAGVSTLDLALLAAVGLLLLVLSQWIATLFPGIPSVLWLTTLALIVGHTKPFRALRGAMQLGTLALHFFFAVIGIRSRIEAIAEVGVEVFLFTLVVVGIHGLVIFGIGRLARLDIGTVAVASQAAIGGPSSALAVAVAKEWKILILPGIVVGLMGYAAGNYLGFAMAYLVRGLGIGL